jgi:hypothetical protein
MLAIPVVTTAIAGPAVRSSEKTHFVFRAYAVGAVISLVGSVVLSPLGVQASIFGTLVAHSVVALYLVALARMKDTPQ